MPVSGLVIRFVPEAQELVAQAQRALRQVSELSLGEPHDAGLPGVLEAADYAAHDAALDCVLRTEGVCAVDVVFHDFSDVREFGRLPRGRKSR